MHDQQVSPSPSPSPSPPSPPSSCITVEMLFALQQLNDRLVQIGAKSTAINMRFKKNKPLYAKVIMNDSFCRLLNLILDKRIATASFQVIIRILEIYLENEWNLLFTYTSYQTTLSTREKDDLIDVQKKLGVLMRNGIEICMTWLEHHSAFPAKLSLLLDESLELLLNYSSSNPPYYKHTRLVCKINSLNDACMAAREDEDAYLELWTEIERVCFA